ncbi:ATP-dependent RecD-like DNA helicase [Clostridium sp. Marseille-Q2269]|uniref:SF1B family DNA helicase RecD2 n=1 Tax=Clostridium sp. Marseille-Q2269 TaxID=2942205 RepID=UPI0020749790|nr:ATP-dependent RecD-like DNA helicase [Clostridium sp. Marseille-Q2269]
MQEIQGYIEDIVFTNDENGYVVAKIMVEKDIVTIVGCMPYIAEGQNLKLKGQWVIHPQFGNQFKVEICEEVVPNTIVGIERYLSSGIISGIGPVTAKKIVKKFGEETLNILDNNIERLTEIEGIGKKKIDTIYESYIKQNEVRNIMMFFQNYGVTPNQCMKVYKRFGENSVSIVKENPYILTDEIRGIGFKTADKIARSLGIAANSPFRIESGINYIINGFCGLGNTYMLLDRLISEAIDVLGVKEEEINENVYNNVAENKLKIEKVNKEDCVFTLPYYYCELGVTKKILNLSLSQYDNLNINIKDEILNFEQSNNIRFHNSQREAIEGALENGVEIITGGPGTGKTTIINCITEIFEKANMRVFMAAPTGRAAKRMSETTGREAKTIHRLLEMGVSGEETEEIFSKGEETPLECDVVIIDEASMIDIILMNTLLKAISIGTRIIIVGDVDQLPSVGPGNVLRDLIESKCVKVVRLKEIFRQSKESMIIVNAHRINDGEMPLINKKDKDFYFIECSDPKRILNTLVDLSNTRLPKFNRSWNKINDIQILSPMRKGILGVSNLNKELQSVLNPKNNMKKEMEFKDYIFRVGDKVMQTKNNYSLKWTKNNGQGEAEGLGIFNGDVGYIEDIDEEKETVQVLFDNERRVVYESLYLDEIDLAYAVTIHKSQGSEFPVVVMPSFQGPPLLMNRNLLYTGITRAKQLVVLVGSLKAINFMVKNDKIFKRYSLLKWRISNVLDNQIINEE